MLPHCTGLDDNAFLLLTQGRDPAFDCLTERALVPARKFRHLDFTGCKRLTNKAIKSLHGSVPELESLCLHGCTALTDDAVVPLFATVPKLTHLDLEELGHISNSSLFALAAAPVQHPFGISPSPTASPSEIRERSRSSEPAIA